MKKILFIILIFLISFYNIKTYEPKKSIDYLKISKNTNLEHFYKLKGKCLNSNNIQNENPTIKIFISAHKECFQIKNPLIYYIQVGAKNKKHFEGMFHDDEGENISEKNDKYCELTAQFWAWKNIHDADYYGFWHYRRFMSFRNENYPMDIYYNVIFNDLNENVYEQLNLTAQSMKENISHYDIIVTTATNINSLDNRVHTNREHYEIASFQFKEDLDVMVEIIKEFYPEFYNISIYYLDEISYGYFCNMFIMKKDIFLKYNEWLFSILEEHEKRRNYTNYDKTAFRVSGYLGERLFGIYYMYLKQNKNYKLLELQRTFFHNVEKDDFLVPFFKEKNVAIVFIITDNYFFPYLSCNIKSIIETSSKENNYDLIIFSYEISSLDRNKIKSLIKNKNNFSIRFKNPKPFLKSLKFFEKNQNLNNFILLLLPNLLSEYKKVLFLQNEMIVKSDLAEIYNENLDNFLIGACVDPNSAGFYKKSSSNRKNYIDNILKLKDPFKFFNKGTILFNLLEFRKTFTINEILDFSVKNNFESFEEDMLNKLCENKTKILDISWNVLTENKDIIFRAPQWMYNNYLKAFESPKIINFNGGLKPWLQPEIEKANDFWEIAIKTPYYHVLLNRMNLYVAENVCKNKGYFETNIKKKTGVIKKFKRLINKFFRFIKKKF